MSSPDALAVRAFLNAVARRVATLAALNGAAIGFGVAALLALVNVPPRATTSLSILTGIALAIVVGVVRWQLANSRRKRVAQLVETRVPACQNVVVTANDLLMFPDRARADITALVMAQAAQAIRALDLRVLFPVRGALRVVFTGFTAWAVILAVGIAIRDGRVSPLTNPFSDATDITGIEVTITPPAYSARPAQVLRDPNRIEALAGSSVRISVRSSAERVALETLGAKDTLSFKGNRLFAGEFRADADGFIALQPTSANGNAGTRYLIGLSVLPDRAPRVRLTAPGKDLFIPDARRTLTLNVEADDDLALSTLKVRYTKVSGSGERFTFTEGEVPLTVTRTQERTWKATGQWNLESLGLSAGDMVVYRAIASDYRPGAPATESDSYIAEILSAGSEAAAGFSIDPEEERYRLSQQMIILKTEKLIAARSSLGSEAYNAQALDLAAEQRRVRAEFVFMMGGEFAEEVGAGEVVGDLNEEAEAEGEADLAAGRMANQGRIALVRAIRAMSGAAALLTEANAPGALVRERAALAQLQRAFSHTRIILRALTVRERLDMSRRMTGVLLDAGRDVRPMFVSDANARVSALRRALRDIAVLSSGVDADAEASAAKSTEAIGNASILAEQLIRIDASDKQLQDIAARLHETSLALRRSRPAEAKALLDRAALQLTTVLKRDVPKGPVASRVVDGGRLEGALSDAVRLPGQVRFAPPL